MEIGATPDENALLSSKVFDEAKEKIGVNLQGGSYMDFEVKEMNANQMNFKNNTFDVIVCNATLEHDKRFWKTLSEIRRVAKEGCIIFIGVPGYTQKHESRKGSISKIYRDIIDSIKQRNYGKLLSDVKNFLTSSNRYNAALTYVIHEAPGDYYRFSKQSVDEIFLEKCQEKEIEELMRPPRIIGKGVYKS